MRELIQALVALILIATSCLSLLYYVSETDAALMWHSFKAVLIFATIIVIVRITTYLSNSIQED